MRLSNHTRALRRRKTLGHDAPLEKRGAELTGHPAAFLDGPAGTQVPKQVMDAVQNYFTSSNANTCGAFATSRANDAMIAAARAAMSDFFNCDSDEVVFGQNMTTITFALSR